MAMERVCSCGRASRGSTRSRGGCMIYWDVEASSEIIECLPSFLRGMYVNL
jgi:hypothetical protein